MGTIGPKRTKPHSRGVSTSPSRLLSLGTDKLGTHPSCINFALNLHRHHKRPLADAYKIAVRQFRSLRAEHQTTLAFAIREAEFYGARFEERREIDKAFSLERKSLVSFLPQSQFAEQFTSSKLPWAMDWKLPGEPKPEEPWTRGVEYQDRVERGVRPDYHPEAPTSVGTQEARATSAL